MITPSSRPKAWGWETSLPLRHFGTRAGILTWAVSGGTLPHSCPLSLFPFSQEATESFHPRLCCLLKHPRASVHHILETTGPFDTLTRSINSLTIKLHLHIRTCTISEASWSTPKHSQGPLVKSVLKDIPRGEPTDRHPTAGPSAACRRAPGALSVRFPGFQVPLGMLGTRSEYGTQALLLG